MIRLDGTAVSVDVKAVRAYSSVVVNNVRPGDNHFIAIVIYNHKFEDISTVPEVFIVPSSELAAVTSHWKEEKRVMRGNLAPFKDRWDTLLTSPVAG